MYCVLHGPYSLGCLGNMSILVTLILVRANITEKKDTQSQKPILTPSLVSCTDGLVHMVWECTWAGGVLVHDRDLMYG